jgi:hypothetical protein
MFLLAMVEIPRLEAKQVSAQCERNQVVVLLAYSQTLPENSICPCFFPFS